MCLILLNFKALEGTTSGQAISEDQKDIFKLTEGHGSPLICFAVTATTGSMSTLGTYFQDNDLEHGYCTGHSLYLNAILAVKGQ